MPYLNWIDDQNLTNAVSLLLKKANEAKNAADSAFNKNVIDPFSATFEMAGFEVDYNTWLKSEKTRQAQKTLQNHIGSFHQTILGHCKDWTNMNTGSVIDLVSTKHKIIAEVKNKYNTLSGGKLVDQYRALEHQVMPKNNIYKGYVGYYVVIIPKRRKRYDIEFTPSDKESGAKCAPNKLIREIDGGSFYDLVTGETNALEQLFNVLPTVIETCSNGQYKIENVDKLKDFFNAAYE